MDPEACSAHPKFLPTPAQPAPRSRLNSARRRRTLARKVTFLMALRQALMLVLELRLALQPQLR